MSTERIPWSRLDSGEFEHAVAMLVCAEHPLGQKFTPGPDGGIDVFAPDGENGRKVFQVKNFPLKFTAAEFRQVKKSLKAVAQTSRDEGWSITEWHLVTPRDSSPGYRAQIEAIVESLAIPAWSWMGLTHLDILAARQPELIDYYLNGGKDRLTDQLAGLTAIIRGDATAQAMRACNPPMSANASGPCKVQRTTIPTTGTTSRPPIIRPARKTNRGWSRSHPSGMARCGCISGCTQNLRPRSVSARSQQLFVST